MRDDEVVHLDRGYLKKTSHDTATMWHYLYWRSIDNFSHNFQIGWLVLNEDTPFLFDYRQ